MTSVGVLDAFAGVLALAGLRPAGAETPKGSASFRPPCVRLWRFKSVLGSFFAFFAKIWPKNMCCSSKSYFFIWPFLPVTWDDLDLYYGHKAQEMILTNVSETIHAIQFKQSRPAPDQPGRREGGGCPRPRRSALGHYPFAGRRLRCRRPGLRAANRQYQQHSASPADQPTHAEYAVGRSQVTRHPASGRTGAHALLLVTNCILH